MSWQSSSSGIVEDFSSSDNDYGSFSTVVVSLRQRPPFYNKTPLRTTKTTKTSACSKSRASLHQPLSNFEAVAEAAAAVITITSADQNGKVHQISQPSLPLDPRRWSREDVRHWLIWTASRNSLSGIDPNRFQMNGKALCLMSLQMFTHRVPIGGKLLYKDFQLRLTSAFHRELLSTTTTKVSKST